MNGNNLFLKITISSIIIILGVASFFLYRFLFMVDDPLLQDQVMPIPNLDLETYEQLKGKQTTNLDELFQGSDNPNNRP